MTTEVPERCTTCRTPIPAGRTRCVGCGKVYGEDNRCPHCNAVSAVRATPTGYVCAACSGPRELLPGTELLGHPTGPVASAQSARGARRAGLRFLGVAAIAGGVLASALAFAIVPGVGGFAVAAAVGALGVGGGALSLRAASRTPEPDEVVADAALQGRIMDLAEQSQGDLTATEVARGLGMTLEQADAALTQMADGSRVSAEITPDGLVHYVFRELRSLSVPPGPRVRVSADPSDQELSDAIEEAAARAEAARASEEG